MENTNIDEVVENAIDDTIEDNKTEIIDSDDTNIGTMTVLSKYDPKSGSFVTDPTPIDMDKMYEDQMDKLDTNTDSDDINIDALNNLLLDKNIEDFSDTMALMPIVQRRLKGEKFNPYPLLPDSLKKVINTQLMENGVKPDSSNRSLASNMLLDEIVEEYKKENDGMDLDIMFAAMQKRLEDTSIEISRDVYGNFMLDNDNDRNQLLDEAIVKAKEDGKLDAAERLQKIKDAVKEGFSLDKFKEFCKTVRIKKFDLEKPSKIYSSFNTKYENHKYSIADVSNAPLVLYLHIRKYSGKYTQQDCDKVCIAFCKYTMNMNPDNIDEHTFMYYFIRNIYMLERLNPRAAVYDTMDDRQRLAYDNIMHNIVECIDNINNRSNNS